jgi:hypothetical protein
MDCSVLVAPPYSVVFLTGEIEFEAPESMNSAIVASTPSCIAIGCMSADDGPSEFKIVRRVERAEGLKLVFDGFASTPDKVLFLMTVNHDLLLKTSVEHSRMRICIWVNHPVEPNKIVIGVL